MISKLRLKCEQEWINCRRCRLSRKRKKVVLGYGNPKSRLVFVGEGPGEFEDKEGVPFIGEAGEMLNLFCKFVNIRRPEDVFIDNIVSCRPPGNRKPSNEEIALCLPRLQEAIYEIDPILIVAMGSIAFKALTNNSTLISKARGDLFTTRIPGWSTFIEYPVFAVFHPAFLLRNRADKRKGRPMDITGDDFATIVKLYDKFKSMSLGVQAPNRKWRSE